MAKASKGKTALKKTGTALKGFAQGALSAGAQILGAGATALNPTAKKRKKTAPKTAKKKAGKRNASRAIRTHKAKSRGVRVAGKAGHSATKPRSVATRRKTATKRATTKKTKTTRRRNTSDYVVSEYLLKTASGKPIRKATQVKLPSGRIIKFTEKLSKAAAIKQAKLQESKRNPSPEAIRKNFAGTVSGSRDLFFPQGTPQGLAKLGKLVSITTEEGTIKPVSGSAWLCADTNEKLHIGSTSNAPLFDGPARSFGKVSKVEYESSKPHLGYRGPIIWFHHMGEESGHKPTLHADGKGGLVFKGGQYRLTKRGIEN